MAPLPVIAGVYRVSIQWNEVGGVRPVNVFHVRSSNDDVTEVSDIIKAAMDPDMFLPLAQTYETEFLDVLPLDGVTPTYRQSLVGVASGATLGDIIPEQAAVLSFRTEQRGPRGRGRLYLGPIGETAADGGHIGGDVVSVTPGAWEDFATAMNADDVALGVASYVHADFHLVNFISVSTNIGTQRRRLLQTRT